MHKQAFFLLLMSFTISTSIHAQYTLEIQEYVLQRWKNIEKESWKNSKEYTYSYITPDSTAITSISYDSLNGISGIGTFYGNSDSLVTSALDSNVLVFNYELNGIYIGFYQNQKVKYVHSYFSGIPIGRWITYFPNGEIATIENYPADTSIYSLCKNYGIGVSNGAVVGIQSASWFSTKGVPHGEWLEFYDNGNIKARKNFHLGLEIGKWEWYYENGIKKVEGGYYEGYLKQHPCDITVVDDPLIFDNDEEIYSAGNFVHIRPKHGIWKYWDEKGNLIKEEQYDQGKLIQPKKKSSVKKK